MSILQSPIATFQFLSPPLLPWLDSLLFFNTNRNWAFLPLLCLTLRFFCSVLQLLSFWLWSSIPYKWLNLCNWFFSTKDVLSILSLPYSSKATSGSVRVGEKYWLCILCSKQMVTAFIIAISKRVGGTNIFWKGEILVRSNLMDLGE